MAGKNLTKKNIFIIAALLILGGGLLAIRLYSETPPSVDTSTGDVGNELKKTDLIRVDNPRSNQIIKSPLVVRGEARGNWFFEASFPVKLYDASGKILALKPAEAKSDWMTTDFVPYEVTLEFSISDTATGTLVLEKDNPSGLPEHADSLSIPVRFR